MVFPAVFNLSSLNGNNGFTINGIIPYGTLGSSVSSAGDINADGIADIIIGASGSDSDDSTSTGQAFVVFGDKAGFGALFNLSSINGVNGFAVNDYTHC